MELVFDTHGNEKQKACAEAWLDPTVTDIVYGGGKGGAKTYTGASLIFGDAFLYAGTHYFIARKELNDLRKFTLPSIIEVFQHWGVHPSLYRYNGQDNVFELYNKSKVFFLEARFLPGDPEYFRFGSMQMTRGWIEEAGEIDYKAKQNLHASIGRWKNDEYNLVGKMLQTCNPAKNYLYSEYYKPNSEGTLPPHKRFIVSLARDNKMLARGYVENLEQILDKNQKERLLNGNWEYDDDPNALVEYDAILDLFTNKIQEDLTEKADRWITADIARFGKDKTVVYVWQGYTIVKIHWYEGQDTGTTATVIKELAEVYKVPRSHIIIDEDGIGGGVLDQLPGAKGFTANSKPQKDENYQNLKTQCHYKLASRINARQMAINTDDSDVVTWITEELEQIKRDKADDDKKLKIVSKDHVKKMLGRSPDFSDAMAMRMFDPPKFGFGSSV